MKQNGSFQVHKFSKSRLSTIDGCELGLRRHRITGLLQVDVTLGREGIRALRRNTDRHLSFTAWIMKCIGVAIGEHRQVHAFYKKRTRLVMFNDVDINLLTERECEGDKVILPCIIRRTNEKSVFEIDQEIRDMQSQPAERSDIGRGLNWSTFMVDLYFSLPGFMRRLVLKTIVKNPGVSKRSMGTVVVTSVGMFGKVSGWIVPPSVHPIMFALGSVMKQPRVRDGHIQIRDILYTTVLFDHDVIDGGPAARFVSHLVRLIETGFGLQEVASH